MQNKKSLSALILLATLKRSEPSNTEVLTEFLAERFETSDVAVETVKLVDHNVLPGTYLDMGEGDTWPEIMTKIESADILIFATPVWWGGHSSEMQRVIERLDEVHDEILQGKTSRLDGKPMGVVVTGDSDGAQHIIGNIANFANAVGMLFPPYATLTVLWDGHKKGEEKTREELLEYYEKDYRKTADTMIEQLKKYAA